jgi:hypothetical protein
VVLGTTSVINSIAAARKTASAVDKHLGGSGNIEEKLAPPIEWNAWLGKAGSFAEEARHEPCRQSADQRIKGFCVVEESLDERSALAEANRCLNCNLRLQISPVKFWGDY